MIEEIDFAGSNLQVCIRDAQKGDRWNRLYMHIRFAYRVNNQSKFWQEAFDAAEAKDTRFNRKPK